MEESICTSYSDKGLASRLYKGTLKTQQQKDKPNFNGQRIWIGIFPKNIDKWPTSTWKDGHYHHIKPTMRYQFTPTRIAKILKAIT